MKLTINELLLNRGLKSSDRVKFVRHKDSRETKIIDGKEYKESLYDLYRSESTRNLFMRYQSEQSKDRFKGVDYIVSFIGEEGRLSRFIGVYKIAGSQSIGIERGKFIYQMEEVSGFEDLKERVIIDWGQATIVFHQYMKDENKKEIVKIGMPVNYVQFKDYHSIVLNRNEFELIFNNDLPEWKEALSAVNCVYLITDKNTGQHYVGSTYDRRDGVWGRWKGYCNTIHNGNKKLLDLTAEDPNYKYNFQYTILQILPIDVTRNEAINYETLYKEKLGSRVYGLNCN